MCATHKYNNIVSLGRSLRPVRHTMSLRYLGGLGKNLAPLRSGDEFFPSPPWYMSEC